MKPTISKEYAPLTREQLAAVEQRLGVLLPQAYRGFLLAHNGGKPKPNAFQTRDGTGSSIDWFLGIHSGPHDNFEGYFINYKVTRRALPTNLIPIGHDPGGNLICLSVQGEDTGAVYFWDHEKETSPPTYANLHLIADSFEGLLDSLYERPKDEWHEIDLMQARGDVGALERLIQSGWDVNTVNPGRGNTLLASCAVYNDIEMMKFLLAHGAQVGHALEWAERRNARDGRSQDAVDLLKGHLERIAASQAERDSNA